MKIGIRITENGIPKGKPMSLYINDKEFEKCRTNRELERLIWTRFRKKFGNSFTEFMYKSKMIEANENND